MPNVFISYSRKDKVFVQKLNTTLDKINRNTWVDWDDIPLSAEWWREIQTGIEAAETFIFIITPSSVESKVCRDEIEYAVKLNKRLVPVVRDDSFDKNRIHPDLSKHNWLFFREEDNFEEAFLSLIKTLDTDLEYVRAHTRLLRRANEWDRNKRKDDLLLSGRDFEDARDWMDKALREDIQPPPSDITIEYIEASKLIVEPLIKKEQYESLKDETLKEYVHNYLEERKRSVESEIQSIVDDRIERKIYSRGHDTPQEMDLQVELGVIENLLGEQTRWHPQSAVDSGNVTPGYEGFTRMKFPCCGTEVAVGFFPNMSQFRADGCEDGDYRKKAKYETVNREIEKIKNAYYEKVEPEFERILATSKREMENILDPRKVLEFRKTRIRDHSDHFSNKYLGRDDIYQISIATPKLLAQGFESCFKIHIIFEDLGSEVKEKIRAVVDENNAKIRAFKDELKTKTKSVLNENKSKHNIYYVEPDHGQFINVKLESHGVLFYDSITKEWNSSLTLKKSNSSLISIDLLAIPFHIYQGTREHLIKLSITNSETGLEYQDKIFNVKVIDYVFNNLSRPLFFRISAGVLTLAFFVIISLTLLQQMDIALGGILGTGVGVIAWAFYKSYNLYKQISLNASKGSRHEYYSYSQKHRWA